MSEKMLDRLTLQDLTYEILKGILSNQNLFVIRRLSKGMKDRIDNFSELEMQLSKEGSISVLPTFFSSFHGSLAIRSRYGWGEKSGWFRSYIDAIHHGLNLNHKLQLEASVEKLIILTENLSRALKSKENFPKVRNISLFIRDRGRNVQQMFCALQDLHELVQNLEVRLEFTPRSPVTLDKTAQHLASLPKSISFVELAIRFLCPATSSIL
jgi:hypothetical protein